MESWVTREEVIAAKRRFIDAMPGFVLPAAYSVARCEAEGFTFAHVNEVGGTHELPAAVLAAVCGYRRGNATIPLTRAKFGEAIELLAPAEPCKAFDHPNLWSWRPLLAESDASASFVAIFIADIDAPATSPAEVSLRARLGSSEATA